MILTFSSSTLHICILDRNVRTSCHLDIETICGAKTADFHWTCQVILVSGVSDIPGTPVKELRNTLSTLSFEHIHQNPTSTTRVCRMLTPPATAGSLPTALYPLPTKPTTST